MLNSIVERHSKLNPLSDTEIQIVRGATKLFLEQGFSRTTHRMIAEETGIGLGTITYHYKAKEDLLELLIEEILDYHLDMIEETLERTNDILLTYALEVTAQIVVCENDQKARDLYYSAYTHPTTYEVIKVWAAKKNYMLLRECLPHLTESDFVALEHITSNIEMAAFTIYCDRYFTLNDKISLILDSLMKIYDIPERERKEIITKILENDYIGRAKEIYDRFVNRIYPQTAGNKSI